MSSEDAAPPTTSLETLPFQEEVALHAFEQEREIEGLPPLRLHAARVPERLGSSPSSPILEKHHHVRKRSADRLGTEPLVKKDTFDSLEDIVDKDILTDTMGLKELDSKQQQLLSQGLHIGANLPPVTERMSEATLDDVYAFADVTSRGNSTVGTGGDVGSSLLETLDEVDSEEEDGVEVEVEAEVILTNMENIQQELPPLRFHATRVPERLSGTAPAVVPITGRRKSLDRKNSNPRSRSRSPSLSKKDTTSTFDGASSLSSLEDIVDSDILTDKMGLEELDCKEQQQISHILHLSSGSLPPLTERMSEASLDDVYAFSDVKTPSLPSRGNSTVGTAGDVGSALLETLDEVDSEDEVEASAGVILTNMENLTIQEHGEDDDEDVASVDPQCGQESNTT